MFDQNLVQFVQIPTHIRGNILDIVLSNTPFIHDLKVEPSDQISSDHFMILFNIGSDIESTQICQNMYTFDFKHANMEGLLMYLLDYDF